LRITGSRKIVDNELFVHRFFDFTNVLSFYFLIAIELGVEEIVVVVGCRNKQVGAFSQRI